MDSRLIELCDAYEDGHVTESEFHEAMVLLGEKRDDEWRKEREAQKS